jgi:hypothetical protein
MWMSLLVKELRHPSYHLGAEDSSFGAEIVLVSALGHRRFLKKENGGDFEQKSRIPAFAKRRRAPKRSAEVAASRFGTEPAFSEITRVSPSPRMLTEIGLSDTTRNAGRNDTQPGPRRGSRWNKPGCGRSPESSLTHSALSFPNREQ